MYLVQRVERRRELRNKVNPSVDDRYGMDYMGSAEFEWGAPFKSLNRILNYNKTYQIERLEDFNKYEKNDYLYYLHIVSIVNNWVKELLPDELEIITLRNFEKMSFDLISIHVGYANHSSIIRKYRKIIDR